MRGRRAALAIGALAFAHAAAWSFVTPAFEGPDEPAHFAYVQHLAETGDAPCQGCARPPFSTELRLALRGVERDAPRDDGGGTTTAASHAPPYYGLGVVPYAAGGDATGRLHAVRLLSALLGALTAALAFLAVRELLPARPLAAFVAGTVVALQPMFAFVAGSVNNDNGVNATVALLVYLLLRALRRGLTPAPAAAIGATLALAPLMKLTGYAALAPALVGLAFLARRHHARADLPAWLALAGAAAAVQAGWALLAGGLGRTAYATPDGDSFEAQPVVETFLGDPLGALSYLVRADFFETYVERGFAAFGHDMAVRFPGWVYVPIALAVLALAALGARGLFVERADRAQLATLAALAVAVIVAVHFAFFGLDAEARAMGEQGRYAFMAMPAWAALAGAASLGLGERRERLAAAVILGAAVTLAAAALVLALERF